MSKIFLILSYIFLVSTPLIISFAILYTLHDHFILQFQTLIAAGISGSIVLGAIFLKRWHDRGVVVNAFKADLVFFSECLARSIAPTPPEHSRRDGVVNITPFGKPQIYNSFINQIGFLEPDLAKKIIDVYNRIMIFIPASSLIDGVSQRDEHQLLVQSHAFVHFRSTAQALKDDIDDLILKM